MKCPKCDSSISSLKVTPVSLTQITGGNLKGAAYLCPSCQSVLGAGPDFLAQIAETVDQLEARLRGR